MIHSRRSLPHPSAGPSHTTSYTRYPYMSAVRTSAPLLLRVEKRAKSGIEGFGHSLGSTLANLTTSATSWSDSMLFYESCRGPGMCGVLSLVRSPGAGMLLSWHVCPKCGLWCLASPLLNYVFHKTLNLVSSAVNSHRSFGASCSMGHIYG